MRIRFRGRCFLQVYFDVLDLCFNCENSYKCPLILTLEDNLAVLRSESIRIENCKLYKKRGDKKCLKSKLTD